MTEFTRLFRAGLFTGTLFVAPLLTTGAFAQAQQPPALPVPRYQSPGVSSIPEPTPQYKLPQTPAITPNATVVEDVIVRVNDQIISRSDLERALEQLRTELAQNHTSPADAAEREKNLLRDLIDQQLLLSKGKELGINPDADVVRRLDEIRKQNNFATMEDLEKAARSQGVSFEDFKANIRNSIVTGQIVRDEVGRTVAQHMSRAEEQKYYDEHKAEFAQPEQVRLSEILVPTAANADDASIAAAQKSSEAIYEKLKAGGDFAALAKSSSGGPTAAQGGDLGLFQRGNGKLAPVLEQKTFALPAGGYTEPIRTRQGFVILKATEHQQAGTPPLKDIEQDVQNAMYQEAIQPALRVYLTKLREDAYIDPRPGFIDSGASPNETRPVFAAYVAPTPKKKQVQKQRMDAAAARLAQSRAAANAPTASSAVQVLDKHGKPKKVKREKVRFGQAPRTALPDAPLLDGNATQTAAAVGTEAAPGTVISPLETSSNTVSANAPPEDDPLAPKAAPRAKTRFSSREPEVKQRKAQQKQAKVIEKAKATPIAATTEEKQTKAVQADALGLNGSTAKKKKVKRKKGDPKERLQEKTVEPAAPLKDNGLPDRLHQVEGPAKSGDAVTRAAQGTSTKPGSSDATTLAPVTQPAPGTTLPSQTPPTNGAASPTSNQPVPQTQNAPQ